MIKFSVIIPTYNCAQYVTKALDSVVAQSYSHFEVIIVDDGSTDNTREILKPYLADTRIKYVFQENKGLAAARNTGIRQAQHDYIALLDADDVWMPEKLKVQAEFLQKNPSVAMMCSNAYKFFNDDLHNSETILTDMPRGEVRGETLFRMLLIGANPIVCPTVVMNRQAVIEVGMYDEELTRLGCEDRDLSLRLMSKYEVRYTGEYVAYYRIRSNSMHSNAEKMNKARRYVLEKAVRTLPQLKKNLPLRIRSYANVYYYDALGYFYVGEYKKVVKRLWKSFCYFPLDKRLYVLFLRMVAHVLKRQKTVKEGI